MIYQYVFYAGRYVDARYDDDFFKYEDLNIYEGGYCYILWEDDIAVWYEILTGGGIFRLPNQEDAPAELKLQLLLLGLT